MGLSNLPPGVTDNMIPGNRPEDQKQEAFLESFYEFEEGARKEHGTGDAYVEALAQWMWDGMGAAYQEGYNQGQHDEALAREQVAEAQQEDFLNKSPLPKNTKEAWMWVIACHPYTIGFPGCGADLYFSSKEKFLKLLGRPLGDFEALIKVWVPKDFEDWDYIPNEY